jgi:hypothetical protein
MNALDPRVQQWLHTCGVSDRTLSRCEPETRLYQDLSAYGEVAEGWMEALEKQYGVDLRGFNFPAHFPPEFAGRSLLTRAILWLVPFAGAVARSRERYAPVTLYMVDAALRRGQWERGADA